MNKSDEKKVNDLIHSIGLKNNLRDSEVREIVESQFRFTQETIRGLKLTEENINDVKTNFIFKYLGKLYFDKKQLKKKNEDGEEKL